VKPLVIGVAGGTGSGKTTAVRKIMEALDSRDVVVIQHDSYYRDRSYLPPEERACVNYDHPDALETDLFADHLELLISNEPAEIPVYDFVSHTRRSETVQVKPASVIVVEGILILTDKRLRSLMDIKVYVDTDDDERFIRRMERDVRERGRSYESVVEQYLSSVKPMHLEFVEPSKRHADIIIPEGGLNRVAIDLVVTKLASLLEQPRPPLDPDIRYQYVEKESHDEHRNHV
jgi:uridine kinase